MWAECNRLLHNTDTSDEFRGLAAIEISIKIELHRGLQFLPTAHHFPLDPDTIQDIKRNGSYLLDQLKRQTLMLLSMSFHIMISCKTIKVPIIERYLRHRCWWSWSRFLMVVKEHIDKMHHDHYFGQYETFAQQVCLQGLSLDLIVIARKIV